jgi:peptide/nickel transport system permease protein
VLRSILKKALEIVITLLLSTVVIFMLVHLAPGDPIETLYGRAIEVAVSDKQEYDAGIEEIRDSLGLNDNLTVQYFRWLGRLAQFNMGESIRTGRPVAVEIVEKLPATVLLAITALLMQIVLGLLFGALSAVRAGKIQDNIIRFVCVFFASVPGFVAGLVLLSIFAVSLNVYIIGGGGLNQIWLPALALALGLAPQSIRIVRASMLTEFGQTYILAARTRGLSKKLIIKSALKNSAIPIITIVSLSFAALLGGSVVIENIFAWPGIGKYALDSILAHDYPVIQGYAFIMVFLVICMNLLVDVLYKVIDPRLRHNKREQVNEQA